MKVDHSVKTTLYSAITVASK